MDKITGRDISFDMSVSNGGRGWFFKDTGESSVNISPILFENRRLFNFLEKIENKVIK